jgi:hypothetical protein
VVFRCFGPDASAVMNGRLIVVWVTEDSSTLAFSAASNSRCSACGSRRRSIPLSRWNSPARWSTIRRSKSSPPRWVSPEVGADLDHALADVQDGYIERAAAEVEHEHGLVLFLVQPVGQRRGRRLVDDPQHLEPGDPARVLGCLALRVVEVGGDGDDRLGDLLAEELRGVVGELA